MIQNPLISVIVPNYNHARFLKQRLDSVFNQTYSNFEVIILDDCSTDESSEVIQLYQKNEKLKQILLNDTNSGASVLQWKKGIEHASGEWIWIAESDDYCELNFLQTLMDSALTKPNCGMLYCQSEDVNENGIAIENRISYTKNFKPNIWESNFEINGIDFIEKYLKVKNVIPNASAVLFKKSLTADLFSENASILKMRYVADWLFWIHISKNTGIGFISQTLNYFREHSSTTRIHDNFNKVQKRLEEEIEVRNKLASILPSINQDEEWEIIYAKWFKQFGSFPYLSSVFYQMKKKDLSLKNYILKFRNYKKRKSQKLL